MTRKVTECDLNKMQAEKHLYSSIAKPVAKAKARFFPGDLL